MSPRDEGASVGGARAWTRTLYREIETGWSDEDDAYLARWVQYPDIGVQADGETREEAVANLISATGDYFGAIRADLDADGFAWAGMFGTEVRKGSTLGTLRDALTEYEKRARSVETSGPAMCVCGHARSEHESSFIDGSKLDCYASYCDRKTFRPAPPGAAPREDAVDSAQPTIGGDDGRDDASGRGGAVRGMAGRDEPSRGGDGLPTQHRRHDSGALHDGVWREEGDAAGPHPDSVGAPGAAPEEPSGVARVMTALEAALHENADVEQLRAQGLSEHDIAEVAGFTAKLRERKILALAGALYRIAQGVEDPKGAARSTLVDLYLPAPPLAGAAPEPEPSVSTGSLTSDD